MRATNESRHLLPLAQDCTEDMCGVNMQVYKVVLKKATAKVLERHAQETSPAFLLAEAEAIRKLCQAYVLHQQKMAQS